MRVAVWDPVWGGGGSTQPKSYYRGDNINPPIRNFWPDFLSGVLLFPKKIPPLRGGFLLFSKISPACGGDLLLSKDPYFCCRFSPFLPWKSSKFSRRFAAGSCYSKNFRRFAAGFCCFQKKSAASRRGFVISRFLRKVGSGDLQWGGSNVNSPVLRKSCEHFKIV